MYNISKLQDQLRMYRLKQILNSGENDMFDQKIDRKKLEELLLQKEQELEKQDENSVDLKNTIKNIDEKKLLDSIINLRHKDVE